MTWERILDPIVPGASDATDEVSEVVDTVDDLLPELPPPLPGLGEVVPDRCRRHDRGVPRGSASRPREKSYSRGPGTWGGATRADVGADGV